MGTRIPDGFVHIPNAPGLAGQLLEAADEIEADRELGIRVASGPSGYHVRQEIADQWHLASAPAAPEGVTATAGDADIEVEWDEVEGAAGYRVFRGLADPVSVTGYPVSGSELLEETAFTDETASVAVPYFYVVVAVASDGNTSAASDPATATITE